MNKYLRKTLISALFLSIGIILPFLTSQIKEIGDTLLPMHLPVMLCGLLCGPWYGLTVGALTPILRAVLFSMPPLYPNACWMSAELATYGLMLGLMYYKSNRKTTPRLYLSLVAAMLSGRIVWGIAKAMLLGVGGKSFPLIAFITGGFIDSALGILLQLILIPIIIKVLRKFTF